MHVGYDGKDMSLVRKCPEGIILKYLVSIDSTSATNGMVV